MPSPRRTPATANSTVAPAYFNRELSWLAFNRRVLEQAQNERHPLLIRLATEDGDQRFGDLAQLLFDQAVLVEGGRLEDPAAFVRRLNTFLTEVVV